MMVGVLLEAQEERDQSLEVEVSVVEVASIASSVWPLIEVG